MVARPPRFEVLDQRDVGRGATDVEGQDVLQARVAPDPERTRDAAGRAGHQQRDRMLLGLLAAHQAAVGAEQRDAALHPGLAELGAQAADVAPHDRADGGVGDRGQGALVFLHLGQHDVAERDRRAGHDLGGESPDAGLVVTVEIGVHQADGDGLDAAGLQRLERGAGGRLVEAEHLVPLSVDATVDFERVLQRCQRYRLGPNDPAGQAAWDKAACDLENMLIPSGDDQADAGALALQHCVGRDGGAVEQCLDLGGRDAGSGADRGDSGQDAGCRCRQASTASCAARTVRQRRRYRFPAAAGR